MSLPALHSPSVPQPAEVGLAAMDLEEPSEAVEKIVDLPRAVEPSTDDTDKQEVLVDEEDLAIDFPQRLPAGVRVDSKGNVFANNTLLFTKNVSPPTLYVNVILCAQWNLSIVVTV